MSQTERIFYIDLSIREGGGVSVADVASRFEVCGRQVKRDIEYMRDRLGAPIVWKASRRRYEYAEAWDCLQAADEKTLLTLAFLTAILEKYAYVPVLSKEFTDLIRERTPVRYISIADKVLYELPDLERIENAVVLALCRALLENEPLDIDYTDANGTRSLRTILPLRLVNYSGKWYCVAQDSKSRELRTFLVSRIAAVAVRKENPRRNVHGGGTEASTTESDCFAHAPSDTDIDRFLSSSYGIFKGEPIGLATLRFYGGAARAVREQRWHPEQTLADTVATNGIPALDLTLPVHDWTELLGRALRCGANCEVIGPPEFRVKWAEEIGKMRMLTDNPRI